MKRPRILAFIVLFPAFVSAADFYVDPQNGDPAGNGSYEKPWQSLQYILDNGFIQSREWDSLPYSSSSHLVNKNADGPVKGGDTIYLRNGSYGELRISSFYNTSSITITAQNGHNPVFRNIQVRSSSNWKILGVTVNPSRYQGASFSTMISLENHSWTGPVNSISVQYCNIASSTSSSSWTKNDWNTKAKNGIRVDGTNMKIGYNSLKNVNFGISVGASYSVVEHNMIENFAGDGLRGLGDHSVFEYNTVKNCYDVNDNHDDGFQSWSRGLDGKVGTGTVKGIVLRGNTIINYEDENQPFRGTLQGIGCFDGMFEDWVVERNVVKVDHWHGISLYGAINSIIRDNIVTDPNGDAGIGPPWIMLNTHKNKTPSQDSLVTCNVSPKLVVADGINLVAELNTLSETGGPRHPSCPPLAPVSPYLQLLLD